MCLPFAFPPAWGQQEGRNFPTPPPEKNLGKEKLEGNEIIVFIIFVSCLLCLLCYLQTPNVSFLCFFSSKFFYLENPNTLQSLMTTVFAPREMDTNAAEPSPASTTILCWRLPWLESGTESLAHTVETCSSIDEYPTFSHAISGSVLFLQKWGLKQPLSHEWLQRYL